MHAFAAIDCPRRVVNMATKVYKDQLLVQDEQGRTPLLIAAQAPIYKFQDIAHDGLDLEEMLEEHLYDDNEEEGDATHLVVDASMHYMHCDNDHDNDEVLQDAKTAMTTTDTNTNNSVTSSSVVHGALPSVIDILLQAEPAASTIPDMHGKLPLHYAMESGKKPHQGLRALTIEAEQQQLQQSLKQSLNITTTTTTTTTTTPPTT
jgi:ankyrin repeat protein